MSSVVAQTALALAAVLGLVVLVALVLRRRAPEGGNMKVVAYRSFGPKRGVAALRVGTEVLLIGITPTDLKVLKSLKESEFRTDPTDEAASRLERLRNIKESLK